MYQFTRWIEIDLGAIEHNFQEVRKIIPASVDMLAVVKSDAYGCGAVEVARTLENAGVNMLAVTTVEEGTELVNNGIKLPVLVLSPLLGFQIGQVLDFGLIPTIDDIEVLRQLQAASRDRGVTTGFHLKVETGMGRAGIMPDQVDNFAAEVIKWDSVQIEGIYSHLATAMMEHKDYARKQLAVFQGVVERLKKSGYPYGKAHLANSAALLDLPETFFDMVRVGTLLYGQYPSNHVSKKLALKDPWKVKAVVISTKTLPPGSSVGYGRDFIAKKSLEVGVVPIGYADGFGLLPHSRPVKPWELFKSTSRALSNMMGIVPVNSVTRNGEKIPVIGRIGMQLCMVDISGRNIKAGDEITVSMRRTTASPRLPRVYLREGKIVAVRSLGKNFYKKEEIANCPENI